MKRTLLSILILSMSLTLLGNPVDENTAKQLAQNFWKENNIMGVKGDKVFKKRMDDARFVNVASQCGYTEFYIFNNEDGNGFVIIAADDCVTPILGYSYENNFAAENLPPNLKGWLDGYAEQIRAAVEMRATATVEIYADWECLRLRKNLPIKSETAISPLITTFWDQGEPYNWSCPYNSLTGEYTLTGCVATAMAQIMKYWNYPTHGYGSHSYSDWFYGNISANFGNTTYQWSSMPSRLYTSSTQAQINAVATLMFHCGVSIEMNYGIGDGSSLFNGSSAYIVYNGYDGYHTYCAENALKNYFGYNSALGRKRTGYYSDSGWINLLKGDLDDYIPILYGGQGTGGHAFICDGYNYNDYFHFNWGWNGQGQGTYNDAYYYINNLNPLSYNYSNNQVAVIGICPPINYISATASPSEGGSVTGSGYYYTNRSCTLHATANAGYSFVNWTENGTQVSTSPSYTFTVNRDRSLKANFQRKNYTITAAASPSNGGTVTGGNSYTYGETCTVKATAKSGYVFVNWTENGTQVSTNANYSFTVSNDRNLVANFQRKYYTISVSANPTVGGSVSGGGSYFQNQTCTVKATAKTGYTFVNWTMNGTQVSTNTNYSFTVSNDRNLVAKFQRKYYTISVSANPTVGGSVSGGGSYFHNQTCTVKATAKTGYTFVNWTMNGTQVSTNANYSFTVNSNKNLVANFTQNSQQTHSIQATSEGDGSIIPSGTIFVIHGTSRAFVMNPNQGNEIKEVFIDGESVGIVSTYIFENVTENHNIHVVFINNNGTDEIETKDVIIYPNPTKDKVTIECEGLNHIRIINTFGQTVYDADHEGEQAVIDLSQMAKGIYMMHIEANGGRIVKKIVVE